MTLGSPQHLFQRLDALGSRLLNLSVSGRSRTALLRQLIVVLIWVLLSDSNCRSVDVNA
jgi:hypothetical protein